MSGHILALCGSVVAGAGGAKLAAGLAAILPPEDLTLVVNTGDDFEHLGLAISPDIDTVIYTLSGLADEVRGWGVAEQCRPRALGIRFAGADTARLSPAFAAALARDDLAGVVICPSNPYLSVDPILALPGLRKRLAGLRVPRLAVSPIVGGKAIKGPAAKLMAELGASVDVFGIAAHDRGLMDGRAIDELDRASAGALAATSIAPYVAQSVMRGASDRAALARAVLAAMEPIS